MRVLDSLIPECAAKVVSQNDSAVVAVPTISFIIQILLVHAIATALPLALRNVDSGKIFFTPTKPINTPVAVANGRAIDRPRRHKRPYLRDISLDT